MIYVLGASGGSGAPEFTYTGTYLFIDDGDKNWRLKLLSSGTLTFTKLGNASKGIDAFLVGGGAGGGVYGGGGGGGYTKTVMVSVTKGTPYVIQIGAGGTFATSGSGKGGDGGQTTAFDAVAAGGYGGTGYNYNPGNKGGNGGSGGCGRHSGVPGSDGGDSTSTDTKQKGYGQKSTPGPNGETGTTREFGEASGTLYSTGGCGWEATKSGGTLPNTNAEGNTGDGGGATSGDTAGSGGSGIVVLRNRRG